jgi:hypothetical protein
MPDSGHPMDRETTNHQQCPELAGALFIRADIATMIRPSLPDVWIESVPP